MEQTEGLLGLLVHRHLVLELTALLSEGAGPIVYPFVAEDLLTAASTIGGGGGPGEDDRARSGIGGGSNDVVDAMLLFPRSLSA